MRLRLEGSVRFSLVDREDLPDSCDAELTISYRIMEEGGVGEELGLTIDAPPGFESIGERPYTFHGVLDHEHVEFGFVSAPYPADWTGRLKAEADMLAAHEQVGGRRMSSETRTIRPYRGVDHFQGVLDRAQLYVGDRPVDGGSRVSLTVDEYLNYPITLRLAADEHDRHENEGRIADGLGDLALATSDVELVVLTSAPRLKMVDVVFAQPSGRAAGGARRSSPSRGSVRVRCVGRSAAATSASTSVWPGSSRRGHCTRGARARGSASRSSSCAPTSAGSASHRSGSPTSSAANSVSIPRSPSTRWSIRRCRCSTPTCPPTPCRCTSTRVCSIGWRSSPTRRSGSNSSASCSWTPSGRSR